MALLFNTFNHFLYKNIVLNERVLIRCRVSAQFHEKNKKKENELSDVVQQLFVMDNPSVWLSVRQEIINKYIVSKERVDGKILNICKQEQRYDIAIAYTKYLRTNGYEVNVFTLIEYIKLLETKETLSNEEENEIINACDEVIQKYDYVPLPVLVTCITALCRTHKWKTALELIEKNYNINTVQPLCWSYIISTAFRNGDMDIGWTKLKKFCYEVNSNCDQSSIYDAYFNHYLNNNRKDLNFHITRIFNLWKDCCIIHSKDIIDYAAKTCQDAGWKVKYVTIDENGHCSNCKNHLSKMVLTDQEFQILVNNIMKKMIIGTDIYQNSSPKELHRFRNFIDTMSPFDIVVDGLNVMYKMKHKMSNASILWDMFPEAKKILIIVRKHYKLPKYWENSMKAIYTYTVQNTTKDDPYILYAALKSGNNAKFISSDLLKQNFCKLESKQIRNLFQKWQYTHQLFIQWDNEYKTFKLKQLVSHDPFPQCKNSCWHIPYKPEELKLKELRNPVNTWVCFCPPQQ